jgi:hypothetical protein
LAVLFVVVSVTYQEMEVEAPCSDRVMEVGLAFHDRWGN